MNEETTKTKAMVPVEIEGVHGYTDEDGTVMLKLRDVARGLGFVMHRNERVTTSGDTYEAVRWNRVREYLRDISFAQLVAQRRHDAILALSDEKLKDCYIPEYTFYRLAMKANNSVANAFQEKIAVEILPAIRKYGAYMTPETLSKAKVDPSYVAELLVKLEQEQERHRKTLEELEEYRNELMTSFDQFERLFAECKQAYATVAFLIKEIENRRSPHTYSKPIRISDIAAEYGLTGRTLNQILKRYGIQYNLNGLWMLAPAYEGQGYTRTEPFEDDKGSWVLHMYWTEHGRQFLHNVLRHHDIYPRK